TREKALAEKLKPSVYTHPLGFYGHGAGPTIGMWDNQGDTKGAGDYPLFENTGYSIELNVTVLVPEWNKEIRIMLEENAFFDGNKVSYYDGRQEKFILID
ncbi:MAG: Xaa-Pro aminopeptidase, partial [Bacteroidetes bacterium]|nr:Xaa-Pro aminopeptidase [Bacteroidota bacterium]